MPFAFPINPDSAIKSAGGAGREAAAGTGPLGAVASVPLSFRPDCFLLRGAQPAGRGGGGNPAASLLGTRVGGWGQQGRPEGRGQGRSAALQPAGELWAPRLRPWLTDLIKRRGAGCFLGQAASLLSCLRSRLASDPLTGWRRTRAGPVVFRQLWSRQTEACPMYLASWWLGGELGPGLRGNACHW